MNVGLIDEFIKIYQGGDQYYLALKSGKIKKTEFGEKKIYKYFKSSQKIDYQVYEKHINGNHYLTLPPIRSDGRCNFGAIDIDNYNNEIIENIISRCKNYPLNPIRTASGGLHLYLYAEDFVSAELMQKALNSFAAKLELQKFEIFPKQLGLKDKDTGSGIKLPCHRVDEISLKKHLDKVHSVMKPLDWFFKFKFSEIKLEELKTDNKVDTHDLEEIIKNIKSKKIHSRGGDVDNHIVDYISITCGLNWTDKQIKKKLSIIKDDVMKGRNAQEHDSFENYINTRIKNFRKKYEIKDPELARKEFLNRIVYLNDTNTYFDKTKNKIYKADAIKIGFSKELAVRNAVQYFTDSRDRIMCESFKYRPKQYDQQNCIITVDKLRYVNKYIPHDLEASPGDVSLFIKLVEHVIPDEIVRTFFLDFICYHYQYPGEKIRFAFILQTAEFQIGKGSIWYAIKNTLGDNVKKVDIEESLDKAKSFLTDRQLVLIDEMKSKGDWDEREEILNKFKLFITEEEHSSRKLYVDYDTIKDSCTNFMFFTNYKDSVVLPPNETRYAVYFSQAKRLADEFYESYHEWISSESGKKALLYWFLNREITPEFNPKGVAPKWTSLTEMSIAGEKSLHQELRSRFDQMLPPFEDDRRVIATTWLFEWCKKNKIKVPRMNDIANFLEKIGGINKGQITIEYNSKYWKPTLWVIRHHDLLKDFSNDKLGTEFLDKYVSDKLIDEIYLFGEVKIKSDY